MRRAVPDDVKPRVVWTTTEDDLRLISAGGVEAVIYTPEPLPDWLPAVADAIEQCGAVAGRAVLADGDREAVQCWVRSWLGEVFGPGLTPALTSLVCADVGALVDRLGELADVSRFRVRMLIEAPTTRCGFHIDTVSPGAPSWGLLRVYNGAGTEYIDPADIVGMGALYAYLRHRERLVRDHDALQRCGDGFGAGVADAGIAALDGARPFARSSASVRTVPAGAVVAFRHVDVGEYWSDEGATAWVHCSPMTGPPRLVVNVTSPQWARPVGRRAVAGRTCR